MRTRHNASLRTEGEARARPHREKWAANASQMRCNARPAAGGRRGAGGAADDWVMVGEGGRASMESITVVNPLHTA
jgi:hypothetical protein